MPRSTASRSTFPAALALLLLTAACEGYIGGAQGPAPASAATDSAPSSDQNSNNTSIDDLQALGCNESTRGTTELGVRRLTKPELIATLTALFGSATMTRPEVVASLSQIPEQTSVTNAQFDNTIVDVEGLEAVATTLAGVGFGDAAATNQLLGCDASDVAQCAEALATTFAAKAFRRHAPQATQQSIRSLITVIGGAEGLKQGLVRVLTSPYFHQHLELGEGAAECTTDCPALDGQATRLRLSEHEVAARLSFQLTGAPPDEALLAAAESAKLGEVAAIAEQAKRLLATPAARQNWQRIATDWLGLHQVPDPDAVAAKDLGVESVGLGAEAREDFQRFVSYEVFDKGASLYGIFTDKVGFPFTDRLATTLGVPRSDSAQTVSGGLGGVLLRPATLMSGTSLTSPILRGVFIKRKVLCAVLPTPDANVVQARVDSAKLTHNEYSNRDFFSELTSPAVCAGCHSQVNSLGFALEQFGPLGAPRDLEVIYDQNGRTGVTHPIATAVEDLHISDQPVPASGATEALEQIAKHDDTRACFDAALIVNTRYRALDATDNCLMAELGELQKAGRPLSEALVRTVANEGIFWKSRTGLE